MVKLIRLKLADVCCTERPAPHFCTILTISFEEDVPFDKKAKFFSTLNKDGWIKVPEIKNGWKAIFKDSSTTGAAINVTKHDVDRASKKSKILQYKAVINLDEEILESFDDNSVF